VTNALRRLAGRERALPALDRLADGEDLAALGAEVRYLRWKRGTSLTLGLSSSAGPLFALLTAEDAAIKVDKLAARAPAGSVLVHAPGLRIARPLADRDLPAQRREGAGTVLSYKPQRRLVLRQEDSVLRCYRRKDLDQVQGRWPQLEEIPLRVPRVLRVRPRRGTLRLEHLAGERIDTTEADLAAWGAALGRWHRLPMPDRAAAPATPPARTAEQIAALVPDQADRARRVAREIEAAECAGSIVWCHGDLSIDQVLRTPDGDLAFLDWDRAGAASATRDLASVIATGSGHAPLTARQREVFLAAYAEHAPVPGGLGAAIRASAFTRVLDHFREAREDWPCRIRASLEELA
jgi:aminoglycoside phosphotransferase